MPRLLKALSNTGEICKRRFRQGFRMRVPIANEVEPLLIEAAYFRLLRWLMRAKPESGPEISARGCSRDLDNRMRTFESGE